MPRSNSETRDTGDVTSGRETHLPHLPALDGLRGVAVAAVVAFHTGHLTGGWLGVDVFFVLSGYLITRLLLVEHARHGSIDLKRFWARRARRLLPALICVILVVAVAERSRGRLAGPTGAKWDTLGALTYTSNWLRLRAGAGYWSRFGPPSLLEHFWSLAIEEQFYVVWPLVMILLTRLRRSATTLFLGAASVVGALWSVILFARTTDASRVYMGTDTRAYALLLGAGMASLGEWRPLWIRAMRWVAPAAASLLAVAFFRLDGTKLITYRGGLIVCTLAAVVTLAGVTTTASPLGRMLSIRPLRWLGSRSYGIYLWHWPMLVAVGVAGQSHAPWARIGLGVVASLAVAEVSYRLIEMPIRRHGLAALRWRPSLPVLGIAMSMAAAGLVLAPLASTSRPSTGRRAPSAASTAPHKSPDPASGTPVGSTPSAPVPSPGPATTVVTATTANPTPITPVATGPVSVTVAPTATGGSRAPVLTRPVGRPMRVMIVGDSVGWNLGEQMMTDQQADNLDVLNLAIPGCPPSYAPLKRRRSAGSVPLVFDQECVDQVNAYRKSVESFRPDVSFVVFGASLVEQNEIAPGVWSSPCEPLFDAWYQTTNREIVAALGSSGGHVVLVGQAYYRSEVTDRTPLFDDQIDCENRMAKDLAQQDGAVSYADLGVWACPTRSCTRRRDGIELRPDGTHFKGPAAQLANGWLLQQILKPSP